MSLTNFREWAYDNSPTWLKGEWGSRVVYMFHVLVDAIADSYRVGTAHTIAGRGDTTSLSYLAQAHGLQRGVFETEEEFALDIARSWEGRKRAGSAGELARRVCRVVYNGAPLRVGVYRVSDFTLTGVSHVVTTPYDEAVVTKGGPLQFNWDSQFANWCRLIVTVDLSGYPGGAEPKALDDGHELGDGTLIGTTLPESTVSLLQSEARKWAAEHSRFIAMHLDYDGLAAGAGASDLQQLYGVNWQGGNSWSCMQSTGGGNTEQQPIGFYWGGAWIPVEAGSH